MVKPDLKLVLIGAAVLVTAVVVTRILRPVINYFENFLFERQTQKRVAEMRDGGKPKQPVRVRQTDITANMTREDRAAYKQGELLVTQGRFVEAAVIFENIRFQRKAIDILEAAGLIDEACGVLIRIKAVGRAGVLFERNKMLDKAARCFTEAGQHENAGKVFVKLAAKNYRYYVSAMEAFAKAEKWDQMMEAAAEVLATGKLIEAAFAHNRAHALGSYLASPEIAYEVLRKLDPDRFKTMLGAVPLTPRTVLIARGWAKASPGDAFDKEVLAFVHREAELCKFFWAGLDSGTRARLVTLVTSPGTLLPEVQKAHLGHAQPAPVTGSKPAA